MVNGDFAVQQKLKGRLARRRRKNPTDVNSCLSAFAGPPMSTAFLRLLFCRPTDVKRFCRPNRCQALLQKTGEAREVSPSRSRLLLSIEATPPGTDLKLFFSYKC